MPAPPAPPLPPAPPAPAAEPAAPPAPEQPGAPTSFAASAPVPDTGHPAFWAAYAEEVHAVQRRREGDEALRAPFGYMRAQADINDRMRAILIDWLVEVHLKFKLLPETLYLTVNLIDRFLALRPVARTRLQLVGVTAMLLASKREEMYPPEVRDFVYITDSAYTAEQIFELEAEMLAALSFRLEAPTAFSFLPRLLRAVGSDERTQLGRLTAYLAERSLQEYPLLRHAPSKLCAAALNVAMRTLQGPAAWGAEAERASGFRQADLRELANELKAVADFGRDQALQLAALQAAQAAALQASGATGAAPPPNPAATLCLRAVFKKYMGARFLEVGALTLPALAE
jgi:cyclin B